MAKKKKSPAKRKPAARQPAPDTFWGLSLEKWRELSGFCFLTLSLLLLLALVSEGLGRAWIGRFGRALAAGARFILGYIGAFVFPLLLLLAAVHAFRGRTPFHPLRKSLSGLTILLALCALQTLHAGGGDAPGAFPAGGVVGAFLISDAPYALRLAARLGPVGAYLVFGALLLFGLMLSTEFLFLPIFRHLATLLRRGLEALRRHRPRNPLRLDALRGRFAFPRIAGRPAARKPQAAAGEFPRRSGAVFPRPVPEESDLFAEAAEAQPSEPQAPELPLNAAPPALEPAAPSGDAMIQTELDFRSENYELPSLELFSNPPHQARQMDQQEVQETSQALEQALADFNIAARVTDVTQGPVVTRYELEPAPGIKVSRILNLENDIALILRAKSVRIQAPIPGKGAIGVEVPNRKVSPVYFRDLIETDAFRAHASPLAFVLGKNIAGEPVICDLASMPHLLIAGTTGSGKSVSINVIISSLLYRMPPDKAKFIMIDPKRVELNVYSDIPHLLAPVVNEPRQAAAALAWAVQQMEERLQLFSELRVRNIDSYNALATGKRAPSRAAIEREGPLRYLPHIVIIIDELADLMITAKNEVEEFIVRLAQMSRAAGIHMVIATQRPSVNVITGLIKANFPSRIAFRVSAKVDSRTILDRNGAETLLGHGDMLFAPGGTEPVRLQGAFLAEHDIEELTDYLRNQNLVQYERTEFEDPAEQSTTPDGDTPTPGGMRLDEPESAEAAPAAPPPARPVQVPTELGRPGAQVEFPDITLKGERDEDEELYDQALRLVLETGKPSVSMIQRRLKIGFARAGRLMDLMEERSIVGPYQGSKPRDLLIDDPEALLRRLDEIERESTN